MQIGSILTLAGTSETDISLPQAPAHKSRKFLTGVPDPRLDVLGKSLLERAVDRLVAAGTRPPVVIFEGETAGHVLPPRSMKASNFIGAWENAVAEWVQQGVALLVLGRTSAYSDLDYEQLVRFHQERQAPLTQVYAPDGPLDVAVVDAAYLRSNGEGAYRKLLNRLIPEQERFFYRGYVNRLRKPNDFCKLIEDGLYGRCELRAASTEVGPGVWYGAGAEVDDSCEITGPAFIGAGTRVAACCTIGGGSVIERNCEIDYGTTIEQAWVLPNTYVGVGLDVRRCIVGKNKMFHLDRKVEIGISDRQLIWQKKPTLSGTGKEHATV